MTKEIQSPSYNQWLGLIRRPLVSVAATLLIAGCVDSSQRPALEQREQYPPQRPFDLYCGQQPAPIEVGSSLSVAVDPEGDNVRIQEVIEYDEAGNPIEVGSGAVVQTSGDGEYYFTNGNNTLPPQRFTKQQLASGNRPFLRSVLSGATFTMGIHSDGTQEDQVVLSASCTAEELPQDFPAV